MSDGAKSKKPANTAFKQQRLRAWQPILTPKTVLPTFFLIGAIFIPLGIGLYIASDKVRELTFDYTECRKPGATPESPITEWSFNEATQDCTITFRVPEFFNPPVFMYYRLTNFYQNHRRYVKSFSANQLKGDIIGPGDKNMATCDPLKSPPAGTLVGGSKEAVAASAQYYPCGLIANSMYSDEISGLTCVDASGAACAGQTTYEFSEQGISWPTDKDRFKQTKFLETLTTPEVLATTLIPPPLWQKAWPKWQDGYNSTNFPNINTWERFQVWMRTAALPTFRKLWGRNMDTTLSPGTWTITIHDTFDVNKFSGTKSIVISTVSLLGGKNPFLGAAYITVGVICWVLGLAFLFRHMIKPRKLGDHTYLSWNQPQAAPQARAPEVGGERSSLMTTR